MHAVQLDVPGATLEVVHAGHVVGHVPFEPGFDAAQDDDLLEAHQESEEAADVEDDLVVGDGAVQLILYYVVKLYVYQSRKCVFGGEVKALI